MTMYKLTFANGKSYIGITSGSLHRRIILHRSHAKKEVRGALQRAIRKYGFNSITVEVIATASGWEELCEMEKVAIVKFNTLAPNGYNVTSGGEGAVGVPISPQQRQAASERTKHLWAQGRMRNRPAGWNHSPEAKLKIADAGKGRIFSDERRAKIGATKLGNKNCVGKICSQETRDKISAAQKGRVFSDEHKAKLRVARRVAA